MNYHRPLVQVIGGSTLVLSLQPAMVGNAEGALREFSTFLATNDREVRGAADVQRRHVEAYKRWLAERPAAHGGPLHRHTIKDRLGVLRNFFERIIEWGYDDAPARVPLFAADFQSPTSHASSTMPRQPNSWSQHVLIRTRLYAWRSSSSRGPGLRKGEFLDLRVDAVVQIGSAYWLRVPVGKLHNDRYIPLHPQLKTFIDAWLTQRPEGLRSDLLFVERGRWLSIARVDRAVAKVARAAGIGHVSPHQLRHILATQAINRA
jgi:site-specific recombinase XerD